MIQEAANFVADPEYHKQFISELSPQDAQYVEAFWKLRDPDAR
jgi:hypothetical protein